MSSHDAHLTRDEVVGRVLDVLKCHPKVDPSKVTPEAHFEKDLGLDSLDTVEVVMAIEEEFKLEIPDLEADKINSLPLAIEKTGPWCSALWRSLLILDATVTFCSIS
ncbi:hypothetical protein CFC21_096819 [Triticum aestivum]|uniref:Acyl carrier protein n=3 Tax=Triticum TaxID=4564 RepID=A0A9R0Z7W2_TRITD|nr:hypothetical protein CFC21_096819 [Triticum aestivum]VAI72163.1 unnamed protein product [Triticum turgidum subsp. durum]